MGKFRCALESSSGWRTFRSRDQPQPYNDNSYQNKGKVDKHGIRIDSTIILSKERMAGTESQQDRLGSRPFAVGAACPETRFDPCTARSRG